MLGVKRRLLLVSIRMPVLLPHPCGFVLLLRHVLCQRPREQPPGFVAQAVHYATQRHYTTHVPSAAS